MNDIDKARLELREHLSHLLKVIMESLPNPKADRDPDEMRSEAEHTMDMIIDAEVVMVQNGVV